MLSDHTIWLIDDNIPVNKIAANFLARDDILSGKRPIDYGLLAYLLAVTSEDDWHDDGVYELCVQLVENAAQIFAFRYPDSALDYLSHTATLPDIIIYDLEYRDHPQPVDDQLCKLLENSFTLAQVYSTVDVAIAQVKLPNSFKKYSPKRLVEPQKKRDCDAKSLTKILNEKLAGSFSAKMTRVVRKSSVAAIEKTLIGLDDLPPMEAFNILLGKNDRTEMLGEQKLVDLIGNKVSDALANDEGFRKELREYAKNIPGAAELADDDVDKATRSLAALVITGAREHIQHSRELLEIIQSVGKEVAKAKAKPELANPQFADATALSQFTSFWMYARPNDDMVRTGDIIHFSDSVKHASLPTLHMILTPPCDLPFFWKKTRGCLTLSVLEPIQDGVAGKMFKAYKNTTSRFTQNIKNVTNGTQGPVLIPALNFGGKIADYVLFSHQVQSRVLSNVEEKDLDQALTYTVMRKVLGVITVDRVARLTEPFLTGVLEHISSTIFQTGLPDIPAPEVARVNDLLNAKIV